MIHNWQIEKTPCKNQKITLDDEMSNKNLKFKFV